MDAPIKYLSNRELPQDKKEAEWIKKKANGSSLIRKSFTSELTAIPCHDM